MDRVIATTIVASQIAVVFAVSSWGLFRVSTWHDQTVLALALLATTQVVSFAASKAI